MSLEHTHNSHCFNRISWTAIFVGAFVGMNDNSTLLRCSSQTPVVGTGNVGGLIGSNHSGHIIECTALAPVAGLDNGVSQQGAAGGLAGLNMGMIRDSYSKSPVYADNHYSLGGVAGTILGQGIIQRTYAAGPVNADVTANVGGLVGDAMDTVYVQSSFWDTDVTGKTTARRMHGRERSVALSATPEAISPFKDELGVPRGDARELLISSNSLIAASQRFEQGDEATLGVEFGRGDRDRTRSLAPRR